MPKVIPNPDIKPPNYVPGIGPEGKDITSAEAKPLLLANLVILAPTKKSDKKKETD